MIPQQAQFDPDELKIAMARACRDDAPLRAPESLHLRVTQLFSEQADATGLETKADRPLRMPWWTRVIPRRRLVLAASVGGLAISTAILLFREQLAMGNSPPATPLIVQTAIDRHDQLTLTQPHSSDYADATASQYRQVANDISKRSGLQIPNINLSGRGWELAGAKTWISQGRVSAQFFYQRETQTLSVLCVPAGSSQSDHKVWRVCGRVVAGHTMGQTGVIVVGHCPEGKLSAGEVDSIADLLTEN